MSPLKYLLKPTVVFDDFLCIVLILGISCFCLGKAVIECEEETRTYTARRCEFEDEKQDTTINHFELAF